MAHFFLKSILLFLCATSIQAQRTFVHPGISHTQADLDRMKAMVDAKAEPFYTTYLALLNDSRSSYNYTIQNVKPTACAQDRMDALFKNDGHAAYNIALLWHITGDERYANKAVEIINNFNSLTNISSRGTGPLNASKIHLLIESAELMRDYQGWLEVDKSAFRKMLVHPGYSSKQIPSEHYSSDDALNDVTWYWNAYNFDSGRHGNQELFPERMLLGMGIFLDNDTIYDRVINYFTNKPHRPDDLSYVPGPRLNMVSTTSGSDFYDEWVSTGSYLGNTPDYGYDGVLKYNIWENGQGQESSRDQGHGVGAISLCASLGEIAWNQGNNIYDLYNNRILLGLEFACRYNLTAMTTYEDQPTLWEPTGYVNGDNGETDATFENGLYIQRMDRTGRWRSLKPSSISRGTVIDRTSHAVWEQHFNHYKVRMNTESEKMKWLGRTYDYVSANYGIEGNGHTTDWVGWGGLTKHRTIWMAGEPVSFATGEREPGIHKIPGSISAVDYDFFTADGEGRTYHNIDPTANTTYRTDGTVDIVSSPQGNVVDSMQSGEWMNYTISVPATRNYYVYATCKSSIASAKLAISFNAGDTIGTTIPVSSAFDEIKLGKISLKKGAGVLRVIVDGTDDALQLSHIRLEETEEVMEEGSTDMKGANQQLR